MDSAIARWLASRAGQDACLVADAELARGGPAHAALGTLRKNLDAIHAAAAWENALARRKAVGRFPSPGSMLFLREGLEQATSLEVARYRAARFAPFETMLDWGAGLGGDSLALSEHGRVLAIERDPARAILHRHNTAGRTVLTVRGDGRVVHPEIAEAAFADPDRRADGRRLLGPNDGSPSLNEVLATTPVNLGVKLAPAADALPWEGSGRSLEWISLGGELKEQVLWRGELARNQRRATVLPSGAWLEGTGRETAPSGEPQGFLLDPDPAVTCSGLASRLALELGGAVLPEGGGFLTVDRPVETPLAFCLEIMAAFPLRPERLKAELKALNAGPIEFRKRNSTADSEALRGKLKTRGDEPLVVALTRHDARDLAIVCRRIAKGASMG